MARYNRSAKGRKATIGTRRKNDVPTRPPHLTLNVARLNFPLNMADFETDAGLARLPVLALSIDGVFAEAEERNGEEAAESKRGLATGAKGVDEPAATFCTLTGGGASASSSDAKSSHEMRPLSLASFSSSSSEGADTADSTVPRRDIG